MNLFRLWRDYRARLVASLLLEALMRMLMFAIVEPDVLQRLMESRSFVMPRMTILNVVTIP